MKAVTSVEETIDVILNYLFTNDLKIHLASVRPGSNCNITKPQLKSRIKKIVMKKFYPGYSLDQDIDELVAASSKQASKLNPDSNVESVQVPPQIVKHDKVGEIVVPGSANKTTVSSKKLHLHCPLRFMMVRVILEMLPLLGDPIL